MKLVVNLCFVMEEDHAAAIQALAKLLRRNVHLKCLKVSAMASLSSAMEVLTAAVGE